MNLFRRRKAAAPPAPPAPDVDWSKAQADAERSYWEAVRRAIAEVEPSAPYAIWQSNPDGWWRVGRWTVRAYPDVSMIGLGLGHSFRAATNWGFPKPGQVGAGGYYQPYDPKFSSMGAAEAFLAETISKGRAQQRYPYDEDGKPVAAEAPVSLKDEDHAPY